MLTLSSPKCVFAHNFAWRPSIGGVSLLSWQKSVTWIIFYFPFHMGVLLTTLPLLIYQLLHILKIYKSIVSFSKPSSSYLLSRTLTPGRLSFPWSLFFFFQDDRKQETGWWDDRDLKHFLLWDIRLFLQGDTGCITCPMLWHLSLETLRRSLIFKQENTWYAVKVIVIMVNEGRVEPCRRNGYDEFWNKRIDGSL